MSLQVENEFEWISLSQSFVQMAESRRAEFKMTVFKMAAIIKLGRMNEFESDWISLSQSQSAVRVLLSESERR